MIECVGELKSKWKCLSWCESLKGSLNRCHVAFLKPLFPNKLIITREYEHSSFWKM